MVGDVRESGKGVLDHSIASVRSGTSTPPGSAGLGADRTNTKACIFPVKGSSAIIIAARR